MKRQRTKKTANFLEKGIIHVFRQIRLMTFSKQDVSKEKNV